jgi:DNA-binding NarL/FixJ family response regulator
LRISQFISCNDCLLTENAFDIILYHAHETLRNLDKNSERTNDALKKLQQISSVIILSSIDGPHFVIKAFEGGARGFIPTPSTTIEMVIEIIRLVSAGGTFVPPSGLRLGKVDWEGTPRATISGYEFTSREMAVLDRLALGKANKIIAHELKMSESTVKVHIKSIMTKLKATNRTEVVCRAFDLAAIEAASRREA